MKKIQLAAILALAMAATSALHAYSGNERSEFANKFMVMKKLAASCRSTSENTSVAALNAMREVFFRSNDNPGLIYSSDQIMPDSFQSLCDKMNSDVDKIYTGVRNLENSLKVSDPYDISDKYLNEILRFLLVSEITLILNDQQFFVTRDKIMNDIQQSRQFVLSAMYIPPTGAENSDLLTLDRLSNLLDLAGYIYNEQVQWLMNCSFSVQNLAVSSYSIAGDSVFKGFATNRPPRLYIPGSPEEYSLSGGSR
ncbi:MAG: hypothetical protein CVV42_09980 [Candidatus Riflebacteria bacterium HGW-Riflebacteria-2]|jgi:hypothetical protein|nr:MAG: hypothetical protein CVV42_09980 [Candidatus Riflebacteria bacterium HGW-Riflebacteria-2]